jgi:hypothetical protein
MQGCRNIVFMETIDIFTHSKYCTMKTSAMALLILAIALLCSCDKKNDGVPSPIGHSVIIPLKVGNFWEFVDSAFTAGEYSWSDTSRVTITDEKDVSLNGKTYHVFYWTWGMPSYDYCSYFVSNESDGFNMFGGTNGTDDFVLTRSLFYKYPVKAGDIWDFYDVMYGSYATFYLADTIQKQCTSKNAIFNTFVGSLSCIEYMQNGYYSKSLFFLSGRMPGSAKELPSASELFIYYKPDLGYVGLVNKANGMVTYKKTLLTYHVD